MDPLGLPFEMYNHAGLYRETELDKPVDTTGEIIDSGDPALDGKVANAIEMIQKLAESQRAEQVFVRHAFRFWMGRNETLNDAPVLQEAYRAYEEQRRQHEGADHIAAHVRCLSLSKGRSRRRRNDYLAYKVRRTITTFSWLGLPAAVFQSITAAGSPSHETVAFTTTHPRFETSPVIQVPISIRRVIRRRHVLRSQLQTSTFFAPLKD